ncbi:MAG: OmpA family protein [Gammaproteobacteria bacterium]|nr:OmpA family protein [Gammaproteobacteria bacterium]
MMYRRLLLASVVLGGLAVAACGGEPPPEPPAPEPQAAGPDLDSLRAYEDSVRAAQEAAARAAAERERAIAEAREILEQRVHFDYDESAIRPDAESVLRQKVAILRASPAVRIRLEGHADERGSVEYNQALGNRRAQSVLDFFGQQGLMAGNFQTTSFGEERPLSAGSNETAWAQNRRVEFVITAGGGSINPAQ